MSRDRILLEGLTYYGYHGAKAAENQIGQTFIIDLALTLPLDAAGKSDDLDQTVDYGDVCRAVREVVEGEPARLIETVADRIANVLLTRFSLRSVWVRVNKPHAPIKDVTFSRVAVEIRRSRPSPVPAPAQS